MDLPKLKEKLLTLRKEGGPSAAIAFLEQHLSSVNDKDSRIEVLGLLRMEYARTNQPKKVAATFEQAVIEYPEDLNALIALGEHIVWLGGDLQRALDVSDRAVSVARKEECLVRHALQIKARAAKKLGRFDIFRTVLEELVRNEYPSTSDIGFEVDVVEGVPAGAVPEELVESFREYAEPSA